MPHESKTAQVQTSGFEMDSPRMDSYAKFRRLEAMEGARTALAVLSLCAGVAVLALSADAMAVYEATHVSGDSLLPLWPDDFDLRPTEALVACGAVVVFASGVSVLAGRVGMVSTLANTRFPLETDLLTRVRTIRCDARRPSRRR